jgi:hypothetical protein
MNMKSKDRDLIPRVRPGDFDIFESYLEAGRRKIIACNALTFDFRVFKNATIIRVRSRKSDQIDS